VKQGHHHPGREVRVQLGRDAARLLAVTECFGDALANVLEARVGLFPQVIAAWQLTPGLDGTAQQLVDRDDRARTPPRRPSGSRSGSPVPAGSARSAAGGGS
jgi:hypothetical protein